MDSDRQTRNTASQGNDGGPPLPPYPLSDGNIGFWLRRGEQLGRAACWIAERAKTWRRHVASKPPIGSPPQPG